MPERAARRQSTAVLCAVALLIGASFFVRHIAGIVYTHSQYSCLVYNPKSVRETPPADYDFLPDDGSWDETRAYARWTNEVIRGELNGATLASFAPFLASDVPRQTTWLRDRLGPLVLAGMAQIPGSDVRTAFLAADLVFPIGVALVLMLLCWDLRPSVSFAIAGTSAVMFFNWQDLLNLTAFLRGAPQNSTIFLRTPYPQFSTIVFALFLIALFRVVQRATFSAAALLAALLALNFYTYFYSWTYALVFVGSVFLLLAATPFMPGLELAFPSPNLRRRTLFSLAAGTGIAFLLSSPVWLGVIGRSAATNETFLRLGGTFSRRPELRYSVPLLILLIALLGWRTCRWTNRWFAMAYLMASVLVMNIQVITGATIQPGHWTAYYIQPFFLIFLLDLLWTLDITGNGRICRLIAIVLVAAGTLINVCKLTAGARQAVEFNRRDAAFEQVLHVLRQPALRGYGFLSNDAYLSQVLPAYVIQKPLLPWYMDPETDVELRSLRMAAARALGAEEGNPIPATAGLTLKGDSILFVLNLHRPFSDALAAHRRVLLKNEDFLVLGPAVLQ